MGTMLDIIGALIVRGTIMVIMLTVTVQLNDALYFKAAARSIQSDMVATVEVLDSDMRNIGYKVTGQSFFTMKPDSISFRVDIDNNDSVDIVTYFLSDSTTLSSTPNPRDRLLYRSVSSINGGNPSIVGSGITQFTIRYYNSSGTETEDPVLITAVEVSLDMEHGYFIYRGLDDRLNGAYPAAHWQRRIHPSNL